MFIINARNLYKYLALPGATDLTVMNDEVMQGCSTSKLPKRMVYGLIKDNIM